jgi:hypothetical protein
MPFLPAPTDDDSGLNRRARKADASNPPKNPARRLFMSNLPVPSEAGRALSPRLPARKASRAVAKSHMRVFRHELEVWAMVEEERQESEAVADASRTSLEQELRLLREGLALAGQSAAALNLVSRRVELQANIDTRRITRRWG